MPCLARTARKYAVRFSDGTECFVLRQVGTASMAGVGTAVRLSWDAAHATAFEVYEKAAEIGGPLRVWVASSRYSRKGDGPRCC